MIKYVVATHGDFAKGIVHSTQMIGGANKQISVISVQPRDNQEDVRRKIEEVLSAKSSGDEMIVMTDILGGNITNLLAEYALKEKLHLVTGVNLPMILEVLFHDESLSAEQVVERAIEQAKAGIVNVSQLLANKGI